MKFLLDENVDARLAHHLTRLGHDVRSITADYPRALPDAEVVALALQDQRILVTNDRDFGELIVRRHLPHAGVIYLRLQETSFSLLTQRIDDVLAHYAERLDCFLVVTRRSVRIRP